MHKPSKYRLVRGQVAGRDGRHVDFSNCFRDGGGGVSGMAATCHSLLAVPWGSQGREVALLPLLRSPSSRGPPDALLSSPAPVCSLAFALASPHLDPFLALGHDSGILSLWSIPSPLASSSSPDLLLRGPHKKRVNALAWHPAAPVLASAAADGSVAVWIHDQPQFRLDLPVSVSALAWSPGGSRLAIMGADNKVRIWNVRKNQVETEWTALHDGPKPADLVWMDEHRVITAGHNKQRERQVQIWDVQANAQVVKSNIDSGTGALSIFWDAPTQLLLLAGRGDSSVRVFEWQDALKKLHPLESAGDPSLGLVGLGMLPRRALDVESSEILRLYGVAGATAQTSIVPIPFLIPRKVKKFDPQLYTDPAPSGEAACTAEEWAAGDGDLAAPTIPMDPALRAGASESTAEARARKAEENKGFRHWNESKDEAPEVFVAPPPDAEEVAKFDDVTYKTVQVVRSSKFRHLFGKALPTRLHVTGVAPGRSIADDCAPIVGSSAFTAFPTDGPGGRITVLPAAFAGRVPDNPSQLETGSAVTSLHFSHFRPSMLLSGQDNASIQIWDIPEGGLTLKSKSSNICTPSSKLSGHRRRVTSLASHPVAGQLLASLSGPAAELKIWDLNKGAEALAHSVEGGWEVSWSWDGRNLAVPCRDGKLRVLDPREKTGFSSAIVMEAHALGEKSWSSAWGREEHTLVSSGFGKGSQRQVKLYDTRKSACVETHNLDISNGVFTTHMDVDTGVLYLAGRGDVSVNFLEVTPGQEKQLHYLGRYQERDPQLGVCFLPKQCATVQDVEMVRVLRLIADRVEPVQIICPRQRKEFFQDDLYPDTRSITTPAATGDAWLGGADPSPVLDSLLPAGMTRLSQAPEVEREKKPSSAYFLEQAAKQAAEKDSAESIKDTLFAKVSSKFKDEEPSKPKDAEVDDDEWDD